MSCSGSDCKNIYANILVLKSVVLSQIGHMKISPQIIGEIDWEKVNSNPFFCPDESAVEKFDELIRELKKKEILLVQNLLLLQKMYL